MFNGSYIFFAANIVCFLILIILFLSVFLKKYIKISRLFKIMCCVALICFGSYIMALMFISSYVTQYLKDSTITDALYIGDKAENALYIRQSSGHESIRPTLYLVEQDATVRYQINKSANLFEYYDADNVILSDGKIITLYNLKLRKEQTIYNAKEKTITFLSLSEDKKTLIFTVLDEMPYSYDNPKSFRKGTDFMFLADKEKLNSSIYSYNLENRTLQKLEYDQDLYGNLTSFPSYIPDSKVVFASNDNILLFELDTGTTTFLTKGFWPRVSKNGNYVVYISFASGYFINMYRYDIEKIKIEQINSDRDNLNEMTEQYIDVGEFLSGNKKISNMSSFFDISDDGNTVAYLSTVTKKDSPNSIVAQYIYYYNFSTNKTVKFNPFEQLEGGRHWQVCTLKLSGNGRYLMFTGNGLAEGETKYLPDIYVKDMQTGELTLLSDTKSTWFSPKIRLKI